MKIAIIGGGASGLFAAIAAKNENNSVVIYEKEKRLGRKILATGNGRCNMTNMNADETHYYSSDVNFIKGAMTRFWVNDTLSLFSDMGLVWKEEERGKIYPYSDTASSVLDVLRRQAERLGIETICEFKVESVVKKGDSFIIKGNNGMSEKYDSVIVATGGKAGSTLGSDGSGYAILKGFGHKITDLKPSLVQIKTETELVRKLKGIKVQANVSVGDKTEYGELLFTDYGISGPPAFFLSSVIGDNEYVKIDIMPEYTYDEVYEMLCSRCAYFYDTPLEEFFTGMLNKRVGQALLKHVGIMPLSRFSSTLNEKELKKLAHAIKSLTLKIEGTASWNNAQVTKGGADVSEFNSVTMQSKLVRGLYACGEVLDVDGDCGGYNLQWAWSSGYLAGVNAAKRGIK